MATDTRDRLTDAAATRFKRDGFRAVGLDQILDDVGITKTAFYKHFSSKDDLMVAALQRQNDWLTGEFIRVVRDHGGPTARGQLAALFDTVEQIMERPDYHGCIFITAAIEFPLPHDPAHQAAVENRRAIEQIIYEIGERAGARDPDQLAKQLCMIIEGAFVSRQLSGDTRCLGTARHIAEQLLDSHLPAISEVA